MNPITQHEFRHCYATRMLNKGVPIDLISKKLGHSNVSTTLNIYVHSDVFERKKNAKHPFNEIKIFNTIWRCLEKFSQSIITHFM